jgi:hypothetical protein
MLLTQPVEHVHADDGKVDAQVVAGADPTGIRKIARVVYRMEGAAVRYNFIDIGTWSILEHGCSHLCLGINSENACFALLWAEISRMQPSARNLSR